MEQKELRNASFFFFSSFSIVGTWLKLLATIYSPLPTC